MKDICHELKSRTQRLSVVGLGYVGLPIAIAFDLNGIDVIGFDLNDRKINAYKLGEDPTNEVGKERLQNCGIHFTSDEVDLCKALFHIVAVPTPINLDHTPDLTPVIKASEIVGRNLRKGSIVVFESTVYPGVTEDICKPILERESGLICGVDFKIGYSPERINPGDKIHRIDNITKIVSGIDKEALNDIKDVYDIIMNGNTYPVSNLKTAEAIKIAENSQRDINIAFMNELAMVFDRMGIDTAEVIEGMNTKWNALGFRPGLVGGHCIGVDPYYFTYEAEKLGYHSQIILSGRKVNDGMSRFIVDATIKQLILAGKRIKDVNLAVLGLTFKENCPDIRNSKVVDIIKGLREYGIEPEIVDPWVDSKDAKEEYNLQLKSIKDVSNVDCIIIAVAHNEFKTMNLEQFDSLFKSVKNSEKVFIDVKSILDKVEVDKKGYSYWRL